MKKSLFVLEVHLNWSSLFGMFAWVANVFISRESSPCVLQDAVAAVYRTAAAAAFKVLLFEHDLSLLSLLCRCVKNVTL